MHEFSMIRSLLKQVAQLQEENEADRVTEIRVEVGPLSGVEPWLLASAFQHLAPGALADEAELVIEEVPLEARCGRCHRSFEVADFCFRCPHCQANEIQVLRGDEFHLSSVTLDRPRNNCHNLLSSSGESVGCLFTGQSSRTKPASMEAPP